MNKLFSKSIMQVKQEIRNKYLSGDSVPQIAQYFGVSARDIYYHLGKLSAEEKGFHAKNSSFKQTLRKGGNGNISKRKKVKSSLDDFE